MQKFLRLAAACSSEATTDARIQLIEAEPGPNLVGRSLSYGTRD